MEVLGATACFLLWLADILIDREAKQEQSRYSRSQEYTCVRACVCIRIFLAFLSLSLYICGQSIYLLIYHLSIYILSIYP